MSDTLQAIGRVRRAMPRNADVMLICDELEKLMRSGSRPKLTRAQIQKNYRLRKKAAKT
jgi:hypothetical protein